MSSDLHLDDFLARLAGLPSDKREEAEQAAIEATSSMLWVPNPGPQTDAYLSEADEIFYGGQAGGGKTDLEIGLALTQHTRSLLLRRTNKEANGLVERMADILGTRDGWSSQQATWRIQGRSIEISGCQLEEDKQKFKGIPRDLYCFDELTDFLESQYTFIIGWNRSTIPGQRCRVIAGSNPPTQPEGLWVIRRWGAWLDPTHHNPARPGELRWYTTIAGVDTEVDGPGPHLLEGETKPVMARSRTFIPSKLSDNPDLAATNYDSVLAGMPERERLAYREGRFDAGLRDELNQTIPTDWIRQAQQRWTPQPPIGVPMCAIGQDIAQGGSDNSVLAIRHDGWYAPMIVVPGKDTPDGPSAAAVAIKHRRDQCKVIVDIGGGWGGDAYAFLRENGIDATSYMGVKVSHRRTKDNTLKFSNIRSEAYWRFREALDPSQEGGSAIALPPDPVMVADLCAPTYSITGAHGIVLESKELVVKRLGRSPDRGDAVIMAWFDGLKQINVSGGWKNHARNKVPKVIMGHQSTRR